MDLRREMQFDFTGSGSIQTHHGYAFGFIVGGGNFDATSIIQGDLKITNVNLDADSDTVADSCDLCPGFNDKADVDGDTVPDDCDVCQRNDDHGPDADKDGLPDACDNCSLVGDNNCDGTVNLEDLALLAGNWLRHITAKSYSLALANASSSASLRRTETM